MKKIFYFISVLTFNKAIAADFSKCFPVKIEKHSRLPFTDTTLTYLLSLNLNDYRNSAVDSFLSILPANYQSKKVIGGGRPKYADALMVVYPNEIVVFIVVRTFTHMNPKSNTLQWNINLFKLENIDHIEIHNGSSCVKGCD